MPKYFTKSNMVIGCLALLAAHRLFMRSCWTAGPRTKWKGPHLKHFSGSWKSSLRCQQANTLTQLSPYARRPLRFFPCFSFCTRQFWNYLRFAWDQCNNVQLWKSKTSVIFLYNLSALWVIVLFLHVNLFVGWDLLLITVVEWQFCIGWCVMRLKFRHRSLDVTFLFRLNITTVIIVIVYYRYLSAMVTVLHLF